MAPPDSHPESDDNDDCVEVAEALTAFGVVVAEVEAGLDVAVASAALLIAASSLAAIDDAAAAGTPVFGLPRLSPSKR